MSAAISTDTWMERVLEAANEVSTTTFEMPANDVQDLDGLPSGREGSFLLLNRGDETVHVGVFSDQDGCLALTRALLQMEDDEDVTEEDRADAIGEIVNILAGVVQRRFDGEGAAVTLGLPIYIRGKLFADNKSETRYVNLSLGPARADLVVVHHETPKSS